MTRAQLDQYHKLRKAGFTHWEALGIIFDVTKESALLKATALLLQDCAPGCVVTVHTKDGEWQGTAKLHVNGKITITKKEDQNHG